MSAAAQTARMVLRAPEARAPVPIPVPQRPRVAPVPVSQPSEPAEQEADRVAQAALAQPPRPHVRRSPPTASLSVTRTPGPAGPVPVPYPALGLDADGGRPLPASLRRDMEPRFGADFSAVRIHTGDGAARASRRLNAAAFTAGSHIGFGRGRFQPERAEGRRLIAHELTHTVQQRGATQPATVQRSVDTTVRTRSEPRVMRLGVQDALDYFADKAVHLPGFTMLTFLLGFNPISLRRVARTPANLLRALIQLLPGGALITQALDNHGIVERVANWAAGQLSILGDIGSMIRQNIDDFLDSLSWRDVFRLGSVWERAKRIVTGPIDRIIAFGRGLISGIVDFIKDAILRPLAALVSRTRGYPLLTAVLGFDPITGDPVERSPATLIGGFMTLIGQQEVWANIQRANAIPRAWAWFQGALAGLLGFVRQIPTAFVNAFRSLELIDIVLVPRAVARVIGVFVGIAGRFFGWAGGTVLSLLEIIFSVVAPGAMGYLRRAGAALASIFRNPIGFVRNLVRAAKLGFQQFARNFIGHLTSGLIAWLTGSLPGIHIPSAFSLAEILKFVLSVLGLTWANLRAKLVRAVGEPAVRAMEMGFDLVATLVRDGPAAAWAQMREALGNLRGMVIDGIVRMVGQLMITRAIPRIVAMFIPGAGFISAIVSIYGTIMTFVQQLSRIAQVVRSFLDSMMAIARGAVGAAAARVESSLAGVLTLAINFIAGFAGLGNMAARVRALIERIRAPIDRAMDRVVTWIVGAARRIGRFVAQAGVPNDPAQRARLGARAGAVVVNRFAGRGVAAAVLDPLLAVVRARYGLTSIHVVRQGLRWAVRAVVNPESTEQTQAMPETAVAGSAPVTAEDRETLLAIYQVVDAELARARGAAAPATARGTHDEPRVVPAGGVEVVAAHITTDMRRGQIDVLAVGPEGAAGPRGVVQRSHGDAIVAGATESERRIRLGKYSEVAAQLSAVGSDRAVAEAAVALLATGEVPQRLRPLGTGWVGGFRTLMALEVRRDPIALATLSSALTLAAAGAIGIGDAFARAGEAATRTMVGGAFPHTAAPALAPLRGAREAVGAPLPADAPSSRGTAAQRDSMLARTRDLIIQAARIRLRSRHRPPRSEIVAAVQEAMRTIMTP